MSKEDDIQDGLGWLGRNRGFVSLMSIVGSIIVTCVIVVSWANSIVNEQQHANHMLDKRLSIAEARMDRYSNTQRDIVNKIQSINEEQLRRTETLNDVQELAETLKRIESKLDP